ncbi:Two-component system sensor histidine kinase [Nitritalea halalkaliphila LW7]|uniref:histidine kinase n=1 Tax=Nitritalea halalkaliphila LW7 TaxID=1189621 RepID=I5C152_9BACT|nr:HAMP domain-containing sensor histidine kinase [Nitritalea halalkaliphila]EIM75554.1 Two-component system sensor histidine kinase [Nitritalea halalkaliphila LW7]
MSIQQRLTLRFTLLAGGLLLVFCLGVYFFSAQNRQTAFYSILEKEASTKLNLFLNSGLDEATLQTIYRNNREILYEVEVAIYEEEDYTLRYHDAVDIDFVKETAEMLAQIQQEVRITFQQEGWDVLGQKFRTQQGSYLVTAAAYDEYGYAKLADLGRFLLLGYLIAIVILFFLGKYFARRALSPISDMIQEAGKITASNLDLRLKMGPNRDELYALAATINALLEKLEKSFDTQKQFVYFMAHEVRTPLAAMITELELSLTRKREKKEYRQVAETVLGDAKKLAKLSGSLLDFARASYDRTAVNFRLQRVDELVLDASQQVQQANPGYRIDLSFEGLTDREEALNVTGNGYLLTIAFVNLMENACKFSSNRTCQVFIAPDVSGVHLKFRDTGVGIPKEEVEEIFEPFFRGKNQSVAFGSGIGLSLVKRIVTLHQGKIAVSSKPGETIFTLHLNHAF